MVVDMIEVALVVATAMDHLDHQDRTADLLLLEEAEDFHQEGRLEAAEITEEIAAVVMTAVESDTLAVVVPIGDTHLAHATERENSRRKLASVVQTL